MTHQPPPGNYPPSGSYPPPPGNYPPPPPGSYPPPGNYPPPPPGNFAPPPPGYAPAPSPLGQLPAEAYTPWISRVGAYLIDSIPIVVVYGGATIFAVVTGDSHCTGYQGGYGGSCYTTYSGLGSLAVFVAWLAMLGYVIWNFGYRQGVTGSSIGKSVLKFKVVAEATGQPIGFGMSVVRQLAHFIDGIILCIGYLFPLWDAKRQTLADKIMSTVCVPLAPTNQPGTY